MNPKTLTRLLPTGIVLLFLIGAGPLRAQQIQLSISPQSISFPADDPDIRASIPADRTVQITMKITGSRTWQLTLRANGQLADASSLAEIPISKISWTATPVPPFRNGSLAANLDQIAAAATWSNFNGRGDLSFFFANEWSYWAGSYSQTVTVTLAVL